MANTADTTDRGHPISVGVSRIEDELKTLRDQPAWSMSPAETREAMVRITRLTAAVAELEARIAAHGDTVEVEADSGATSTANWWAHATKQTRAAAHRKTRLAAALGSDGVRAGPGGAGGGSAAGRPGRSDRDRGAGTPSRPRTPGRGGCVGDAGRVRRRLRRQGAPDPRAADPGGGRPRRSARPTKPRCWRRRSGRPRLRRCSGWSMTGTGKCHGRFSIPAHVGAQLRKALLANAAPKHRASVDGQAPEPGRGRRRRDGAGVRDYITDYPAEDSPTPAACARPWW